MRSVAGILAVLAGVTCARGIASAEEPAPPPTAAVRQKITPGRVASPVRSTAKPDQSYALYVPSNYDSTRSWPIVYVFDPGAQGLRPVELMQHAAERYGYLLAASHSSRNGPWQVSQEAAIEMWDDTHRFLAIDDRRVYFAGFSGGARVSAELAQGCRCARGVFLDGAGFNPSLPPRADVRFAVFALAGRDDFNYGELVELDEQLDGLGFRHELRRFDGEHAWAPESEWDEALAWASLFEMKDGLRSRDQAAIAAALARAVERGRGLEEQGEGASALGEYRAANVLLEGLTGTAALTARIEVLRRDPSTRSSLEREKQSIARQRALEAEIVGSMDALTTAGSERITLQAAAARRIRELRSDLASAKRVEERRALKRTQGSVYVWGMDAGRRQLEGGGARIAASFFALAAETRPEQAAPHLALARCQMALGDEKAAFRELERALATGLTPDRLAAAVGADPKLAPLAARADFQKLLTPPAPSPAAP